MRRIYASLLLLLFCTGLALPFVQGGPNRLPACCRRAGKHHCTMPLGGDGLRTPAASCPFRHSAPLISHSTAHKPPSAFCAATQACGEFVAPQSPDVSHRVAGNTQDRGPPSLA